MKLEWNMGGWFGSQLGGTAWILVAAAISLGKDLSTGLLLLLIFTVFNIAASALWFKKPFTCYLSMQIMLAAVGLCGLLAIYVLDRNDLWLAIQKGGAISAELAFTLLTVIVLIVMAILHIKFGRHSSGTRT